MVVNNKYYRKNVSFDYFIIVTLKFWLNYISFQLNVPVYNFSVISGPRITKEYVHFAVFKGLSSIPQLNGQSECRRVDLARSQKPLHVIIIFKKVGFVRKSSR